MSPLRRRTRRKLERRARHRGGRPVAVSLWLALVVALVALAIGVARALPPP